MDKIKIDLTCRTKIVQSIKINKTAVKIMSFKIKYGFFYKTRENSNFLKNGKMVISIKIRNFSRSRMTKRTSPLESSREI